MICLNGALKNRISQQWIRQKITPVDWMDGQVKEFLLTLGKMRSGLMKIMDGDLVIGIVLTAVCLLVHCVM